MFIRRGMTMALGAFIGLSFLPGILAAGLYPYNFSVPPDNILPDSLQAQDGTHTIDVSGFCNGSGLNFLDNPYTELQVSANGVVQFGPDTGTGAVNLSRPTAGLGVGDPVYGPYIAPLWERTQDPSTAGSEVRIFSCTAANTTTGPDCAIGLLENAPNRLTGLLLDYFHNIAQNYVGTYSAHALLITWAGMKEYGVTATATNNFQLGLITDCCQTYILLNYATIGWTGSTGQRPRAAISAGDGVTWLELPDSEAATLGNLATESNVNDPAKPGYFAFRVDRAAVMELCPAACGVFGFGVCGTYGCTCTVAPPTGAVDCTDTIYSDMTWFVPAANCPTPCGGCSTWTGMHYTDDCATPTTLTEDCNVEKCDTALHARTEVVWKNGRNIRRNRKCCYKFSQNPPTKYSTTLFPDGKSCCRPRVKGWTGTSPAPYEC